MESHWASHYADSARSFFASSLHNTMLISRHSIVSLLFAFSLAIFGDAVAVRCEQETLPFHFHLIHFRRASFHTRINEGKKQQTRVRESSICERSAKNAELRLCLCSSARHASLCNCSWEFVWDNKILGKFVIGIRSRFSVFLDFFCVFCSCLNVASPVPCRRQLSTCLVKNMMVMKIQNTEEGPKLQNTNCITVF